MEIATTLIPGPIATVTGMETVSPTHAPETDPIVVVMFCANELWDAKIKKMIIKKL